jgi:hypothetical protein
MSFKQPVAEKQIKTACNIQKKIDFVLYRQSKLVIRNPLNQGFLTTAGRFVNRVEALHIAIDCQQVDHSKVIKGSFLYSVDLY